MSDGTRSRGRLGDILIATGLLTPQQLETALARQCERKCRLGEVIVRDGMLTQDQINWALAQHFGLSYVDVPRDTLDVGLIRSLRPGLLWQHQCIPLMRLGNTISLAIADPTDSDAVLEVSDTTGCTVECSIASADAILAALESVFTREELRHATAEEPAAAGFARMASHPVPRQRLGEILVESLLITEEQLDAALARQKDSGKRLGETLVDDGVLTEDQINWALARHLDVPYIDLTSEMVDPALLDAVPAGFLRDHLCVPFARSERQVVLAVVDPLDHEAIARVARATRCTVVVAIARRRAIEAVLSRLCRAQPEPGAGLRPLPADLAVSGAAGQAAARPITRRPGPLSPDAAETFKETLRQSSLPPEEKIKVHQVLRSTSAARAEGGPEAERAARQKGFATLTPGGMKLALQLASQVGSREVPALKDEELVPSHGRAGVLYPADRRFVIDRRTYDRTILEHAQQYRLDSLQIENAVMAARAYVASGGRKQILLISEGEKRLAEALSKIIRYARTREGAARPADGKVSEPSYRGRERRVASRTVQEALNAALGKSQLDADRRDKVVRAFRLIHQELKGAFDREKLKALIRRGVFAGFSPDEIALVERTMRLYGYDLG